VGEHGRSGGDGHHQQRQLEGAEVSGCGGRRQSERLVDLYGSVLEEDRSILYFDPAGDGAMVELHGDIDADTTNVGTFVPGTGSDLSRFEDNASTSRSFLSGYAGEDLAMVTWLGGDMPDSVLKDAPFANYALDMGPDLANFSNDLRQEIEHSAASGNDVQTTYAGHSYGGAVVGESEVYGLDADRGPAHRVRRHGP